MTQIDILRFNRKSHAPENEIYKRQHFPPKCLEMQAIKKGPSAKAFLPTVGQKIDGDLAVLLGMTHYDLKNEHTSGYMPVVFSLDNTEVIVFIKSVDCEPDRTLYPEWLFKGTNGHPLRGNAFLIRGWYAPMPKEGKRKKNLYELPIKPCIMGYSPEEPWCKGHFSEIEGSGPPETGIIKDFVALSGIINTHFRDGFVEVCAPDQETRWGRIISIDFEYVNHVSVSAFYEKGAWRYDRPKRSDFSISIIGTKRYRESRPLELLGEALLCADGTILHSYYFDSDSFGEKNCPATWKEGYYFNRFYPKDSKRIPEGVLASFNASMPEHYRRELLERVAV